MCRSRNKGVVHNLPQIPSAAWWMSHVLPHNACLNPRVKLLKCKWVIEDNNLIIIQIIPYSKDVIILIPVILKRLLSNTCNEYVRRSDSMLALKFEVSQSRFNVDYRKVLKWNIWRRMLGRRHMNSLSTA